MKVACPYCGLVKSGLVSTNGDEGATLLDCFAVELADGSCGTGCKRSFVFVWRKTTHTQCIKLAEQPS